MKALRIVLLALILLVAGCGTTEQHTTTSNYAGGSSDTGVTYWYNVGGSSPGLSVMPNFSGGVSVPMTF